MSDWNCGEGVVVFLLNLYPSPHTSVMHTKTYNPGQNFGTLLTISAKITLIKGLPDIYNNSPHYPLPLPPPSNVETNYSISECFPNSSQH